MNAIVPNQIQTLDNQLPVILLAIRLRSLDLEHLIPGNGPPKLQGQPLCNLAPMMTIFNQLALTVFDTFVFQINFKIIFHLFNVYEPFYVYF